jgi:hypothetical protein
MAMASLVAFQQHRSVLTQRMVQVRSQVSVEATAAAADRLELVTAMPFDEALLSGPVSSATELTSFVSGAGQLGESSGLNDVDDFDGVVSEEIRSASGKSLRFRTTTRVSYVSEADGETPVGYMTRLKHVTVIAVALDIPAADTVRVTEIVDCGELCTW